MSCGSLFVRSVLTVALCSATLIDSSPVASRQLNPRTTLQDLAKVKGAVLTKDGMQLSCGVGLLDNKASLISADCLAFKDGSIDKNAEYVLYVDSGFDGSTYQYDISKITVHPEFNRKTKANNVALLEYNLGSQNSWYNYNSVDRDKWDELIYVQRVLTDVETGEWGTSKMYLQSLESSNDTKCSNLSDIFKSNKDDYTCNDALAQAPLSNLSSCKVPYDTVYGLTNNIIYQAGFFSHAVVKDGSDLCDYDTVRTYYILIANYLMWVNSITGRTIYYFMTSDGDSKPPPSNPNYNMDDVSSATVDGTTVVTGNQYNLEGKDESLDSESNSADDASDIDDASDASSASDSKDDSGLSRKNTIIIAVCCSVGTLLLAFGVYFGVRKCLAKWGHPHDPYATNRVQELLTDDIGGASFPEQRQQQQQLQYDQRRDFILEDPLFDRPPPAYPAGEQRPANYTNGAANPAGGQIPANNANGVANPEEPLMYQPVSPEDHHRDEKS